MTTLWYRLDQIGATIVRHGRLTAVQIAEVMVFRASYQQARAATGRPARPVPSVTALLTALRTTLNIPAGTTARIGRGATPG